jgi:hypothetical protein
LLVVWVKQGPNVVGRQSHRFEMVPDNFGRDSYAIDHDTSLPKEKIAEAFEYVLPILVACKIIFPNMEVKQSERTEKVINW